MKSRSIKITLFSILAIAIIISNVILVNKLIQPNLMLSPNLAPAAEQNITFLFFIIFGSIIFSLVVLFVLFYFLIIKN